MADSSPMTGLLPRFDWHVPMPAPMTPDGAALAAERGLSRRIVRMLGRRGILDAAELRLVLDPPEHGLHDPRLLPDAARFRDRIRLAVARHERVQVFGDFDADGLTGLTIMVLALRALGLDVEPYVPSRVDEGHGLSLAAVRRATSEGRTIIVTVDCGTTSVAEAAAARDAGIDVLISDHHQIPATLPDVAALVNPHLPGSRYPECNLSGAGVAFKLAALVLADEPDGPARANALADLAAIGSIADVVPISGENRAIVRLGLRQLRAAARPSLAALMAAARVEPAGVDAEGIAWGIAPRINAAGRVGDAASAARLLLADDAGEIARLAADVEAANTLRRDLLDAALAEARTAVAAEEEASATVVCGPWPIGVIGLVAGRLAEDLVRPAVVFSTLADPWRGSARSSGGFDLARAFTACGDLFDRFGGHPAAAGCHMPASAYPIFRERFTALVPLLPAATRVPSVRVDMALRAESVDFVLLRELDIVADGADLQPLLGIEGLVLGRARDAAGGHTQLTLRKGNEVIDAICFGRSDLTETLQPVQRIDVVARLASRSFGGFETLQLDIVDCAPEGWLADRIRAGRLAGPAVQASAEREPSPPRVTQVAPDDAGPVSPVVRQAPPERVSTPPAPLSISEPVRVP